MPRKATKKKPAKKKKPVKKTAKKQEPEFKEVQVNLSNVFPHMLSQLSSLLIRLNKLQKTVDAIGILLAENAIKKD